MKTVREDEKNWSTVIMIFVCAVAENEIIISTFMDLRVNLSWLLAQNSDLIPRY